MIVFYIVIVFIIGSLFGSFGGVLLQSLQYPLNRTELKRVLTGRSRCDFSGKTLPRYDLIPVVSYFLLKGKSRFTDQQLSKAYLVLEIGCGLLGVATLFFTMDFFPILNFDYMFWIYFMYFFVIHRLFFLLAMYDFQKYELHVPLWIILLLRVLFFQIFGIIGNYQWSFFIGPLLAFLFRGIYMFGKRYGKARNLDGEAFGEGDVRFAFVIGLLFTHIFEYKVMMMSRFGVIEMGFWYILMSSLRGIFLFFVLKVGKVADHPLIPFIPAMILGYFSLYIML